MRASQDYTDLGKPEGHSKALSQKTHNKLELLATEMAKQVKMLVTKSDDLDSISGNHLGPEGNQAHKLFSAVPHVPGHMHGYTSIHTENK